MPRIDAETLAEHVERQEQRVFESAIGLFVERGYEPVTFGDIAQEVGLARSSLYRYFPGKAAILARWIDRELEASGRRSEEILGQSGSLEDRVLAWVADQVEYSRRPEHTLLVSFATARDELDPETLANLQASHGRILGPLISTFKEAGIPGSPDLVASLILGLANQASNQPPGRDEETLGLVRKAVGALIRNE